VSLFDKCRAYTRPEEVKAAGLYPYFREIESGPGRRTVVQGREMLMIGSNNYLGLTSDPRVIEASTEATRKYGSGCTGSRFLNGTLDLHVRLEEQLAEFVGKEACQTFSTGFQANMGTIAPLVQKGEYIITDRSDHASIVDGCRLAFGKQLKYDHRDMSDLESRLRHAQKENRNALVVTDGVFSMEGDIAPLREMTALCKSYGAALMVDDAHSMGVLGPIGNGTSAHLGVTDDVDIITGTFSKSFACLGGFVCANAEVISWVKHMSRALIFSASITPASAAAALTSLKIIREEPEHRAKLWTNTKYIHEGFHSLGFDIGHSETPIVPVLIGEDDDCFRFWLRLTEEGIFANPAILPAVEPGKAIIRTSYMSTHTRDDLDFILEVFEKLGVEFGLINPSASRG
jgi:8-amino-7-oxononanoate synthase